MFARHRGCWAWMLVAVMGMVAVLAWAPWLSPSRATRAVSAAFDARWNGVADGCGLIDPDIRAVQRHWFGYTVPIEYACGLRPSLLPNDLADVYVSPFGTVHGLP